MAFGEHDRRFIGVYTYNERIVSSVAVRKCIINQNPVMKRIFAALRDKVSQAEDPVADDQSSNVVCDESDDLVNNDYEVEMSYDAEIPGRIESQGPGKNVLMPDIYGDEYVATVPDLKIIDLSSSGVDESTGFNPYDTAVLRKG